jgi:hypothetical protein
MERTVVVFDTTISLFIAEMWRRFKQVMCMSEGKAEDFVNKEATFGSCVFNTSWQTLRGVMTDCI